MKRGLLRKKKSVAQAMMISYIAIILICVSVIVLISIQYEKALREETENMSGYLFSGVSQSVREVLFDIRELNGQLVEDSDIQFVVNNQQDANFWKYENTISGIETLKRHVTNKKNVDLGFIYLKMSDEILSHHGILSSEVFYDMYFKGSSISYEDWISTLRLNEKETHLTLNYNMNQETISTITLLSPTSAEKNAVCVVMADKRKFLKGLNQDNLDLSDKYDIYVYNSFERLIFSENNTNEDIPHTLSELKTMMQKNKDSVYIVSDMAEASDWYVAIAVSKRTFNVKILFMRFFVLTIFVIALIILTFLVRYLVAKNYRHVKGLMSILDLKPNENEYQSLYSSVRQIIGENKALQKEYNRKNMQIRQIFLSQLIQGDAVLEDCEKYGIDFLQDYFAVIAFYLEDISTLFSEEAKLTTASRKEYLGLIINNVAEEKFATEKMRGYVCEASGLVVCLVNIDNNEKNTLLEVENIAQEALSFINSQFNIELTFSLSGIYSGQNGIERAYSETMEALEYKWRMGIDQPILYSDITFDYSDCLLFDADKENSLVEAIRSGNASWAQSITNQIFDVLEKEGSFSKEYIKYTVSDVLRVVTKTSLPLLEGKASVSEEIMLYQELQNEKLPIIREKICMHIQTVCDEIINRKSDESGSRRQKKIQNVIDFVEKNYHDPSLNVTAIGDYFNMSPFYVSKLFKEEMGVTLIDYLNRCRINKAREMMENTNYSVKHIAEQVGFNHVKTFYRLLKKYME